MFERFLTYDQMGRRIWVERVIVFGVQEVERLGPSMGADAEFGVEALPSCLEAVEA